MEMFFLWESICMASPPHAKGRPFFVPPKLLSLGQTGVIITVRLLFSLLILGGNIASPGLGGTDCVFCEMEMCLI